MTDADLQMLVDFRHEVPSPDEDTATRIYARATSRRRRRLSPLAPLRRSRRPRLVLALVLAALVIVPAAVAFGSRIVDLFEGSPPSPGISIAYAAFNHNADEAVQQGFAGWFPRVDLRGLHGVIETRTADGPEDLWTAPNDQGGQCWWIDFANDPLSEGHQLGNGTCDTATPPASNISIEDFWRDEHPSLATVDGRVYVDASSVQLTLADGSTVTAPVVEGFYLFSLGKSDKVTQATAYNAAGSSVAEWTRP
jgi:hypothetical protein